jgi:hypothetical protein
MIYCDKHVNQTSKNLFLFLKNHNQKELAVNILYITLVL